MDKFYGVLVLAVAAVLIMSVQAHDCTIQQCGENQEFTECGTACPERCNAPISHIVCIQKCVVGCQCKPGYLLNDKNECVCPAKCQKGIWNHFN